MWLWRQSSTVMKPYSYSQWFHFLFFSFPFLLAFSSRLLMVFFVCFFHPSFISSLSHLNHPCKLVRFNSWSSPSPSVLSLHLFVSTEIHKNVISPLEGDTKEHVLQQKHTDLKQKMRDLNQGFERLRKLSHEGFTEDSGEKTHTCIKLLSFCTSVSLRISSA